MMKVSKLRLAAARPHIKLWAPTCLQETDLDLPPERNPSKSQYDLFRTRKRTEFFGLFWPLRTCTPPGCPIDRWTPSTRPRSIPPPRRRAPACWSASRNTTGRPGDMSGFPHLQWRGITRPKELVPFLPRGFARDLGGREIM